MILDFLLFILSITVTKLSLSFENLSSIHSPWGGGGRGGGDTPGEEYSGFCTLHRLGLLFFFVVFFLLLFCCCCCCFLVEG